MFDALDAALRRAQKIETFLRHIKPNVDDADQVREHSKAVVSLIDLTTYLGQLKNVETSTA